jgi:hypothetical protein
MSKMNKLRQRLQSFDGSAKLSSDGRSMLLTSEDFEVLTCALAMVDGVDWELLRSQKEVLVGLLLNKSVPEELEGLVGLLDTIQDHVVECGEATELEVFGSETTSELGLKKVLNQIGLRLSGIDKSVLTTAEKQIVWILIAAGIVVFKEGTVTYLGDVNEG